MPAPNNYGGTMRKHRSLARSASLFLVLVALVASAAPALADGSETLGAPSIAIADGSGTVAAGVGLWNGPGTINLEVPGDVVQALLYWEGHTAGPGYDDTISVNGVSVTGTVIGGPTQFFGSTYSTTVRADITALGLVDEGNNALHITDMNFNRGNNGAGLLVIFDDDTTAEIDIRDGNDLAFHAYDSPLDTTVPQTFTFAAEAEDRVADLTIFASSVADGEFRPTAVEVQSGVVTVVYDNQLASNNGGEWDTLEIPVPIAAGASTLTVQVKSVDNLATGARPASLAWIGAGLSVPVTPPTNECPPKKDKSKYSKYSSSWSSWSWGTSKYSKKTTNDPCEPVRDDCKWSLPWKKHKDCKDGYSKPKKGKYSWDWGSSDKNWKKKGKWTCKKGKWYWSAG